MHFSWSFSWKDNQMLVQYEGQLPNTKSHEYSSQEYQKEEELALLYMVLLPS